MAFFAHNDITGLTNITVGQTDLGPTYDIKYNDADIMSYYKVDGTVGNIKVYYVFVIFGNRTQKFQFTSTTDRDTFYTSLP